MENNYPIYNTHVLIVGCGASALNACDELYKNGEKNIMIVCPKIEDGISRNTGSDKQTFYKLSTTGDEKDSVYTMANTLYNGKSINGDICLTLSANSLYSFYKLVGLGVPFPQNEYGEYVGYRTDHDNNKRASSCGPLTSKYMTISLENKVKQNGTKIFTDVYVTSILVNNDHVCGVIAFSDKEVTDNNEHGKFYIEADEIVWATGGPSTIYKYSVYPISAGCSLGFPILAGANCANLTESQYGIASTGFRWNLSGSYQQAIPRYISIDSNDNQKEFLFDYMNENDVYNDIFKKGYEWPFNPEKKSSYIDLAVQNEINNGNKVYLDYMHNPYGFDFSKLDKETYSYLENSDALLSTPYERLKKINPKACSLFFDNGYNLENQLLNISVCAQHLNGGLDIDINGESTNIKNLYFVGECAGTFGVKRPGGSALLAGQVFSMRCAKKISSQYASHHDDIESIIENENTIDKQLLKGDTNENDIDCILNKYQTKFSKYCSFIRCKNDISFFIDELKTFLDNYSQVIKPNSHKAYIKAINLYDILITQLTIATSILYYINDGGQSRGSYIISNEPIKEIIKNYSNNLIDTNHDELIELTRYSNRNIVCEFKNRRPIPNSEQWFEKVYNK